jgi:hypothetical protein
LGFTYVGPLAMGASSTVMDVVYDTGSDWLAVEGSECKTCAGNTYDGSAGTKTSTTISERNYGSASLTGYTWKDKICVTSSACIDDFEYFLIATQKGVNGYAGLSEPVDGILGMSRDIVPKGTKYEVGPLVVKALKDKGLTQYNVFSFYLTDPDK